MAAIMHRLSSLIKAQSGLGHGKQLWKRRPSLLWSLSRAAFLRSACPRRTAPNIWRLCRSPPAARGWAVTCPEEFRKTRVLSSQKSHVSKAAYWIAEHLYEQGYPLGTANGFVHIDGGCNEVARALVRRAIAARADRAPLSAKRRRCLVSAGAPDGKSATRRVIPHSGETARGGSMSTTRHPDRNLILRRSSDMSSVLRNRLEIPRRTRCCARHRARGAELDCSFWAASAELQSRRSDYRRQLVRSLRVTHQSPALNLRSP